MAKKNRRRKGKLGHVQLMCQLQLNSVKKLGKPILITTLKISVYKNK